MKLNKTFTLVATLVGAALVISGPRAHATASIDDLLLCFQTTTGNGSTVNLELDLGPAQSLTSGSFNIDSDLKSIYGGGTDAGWDARNDLYWGVVGGNYRTTPPVAETVWVSLPDGTGGVGTYSPAFPGTATTQQAASKDLGNYGYNLFNSGNATAGSIAQDEIVSNTTTGSFGASVGAFNNVFTNIEQVTPDYGSFTGSNSVDLFLMTPGASSATDIGSVTLSSSGIVTVAAVPEPATWACMGMGALALVAFRRRRIA